MKVNIRSLFISVLLEARYIVLGPMSRWPKKWVARKAYKLYSTSLGEGSTYDINHPKKFTEKIQWLLFNSDEKIVNRITDKVTFKEYVREKMGPGYTLPLYGVWSNAKDFKNDWPKLPESFCLKSNLQGDGRCVKLICHKSDENVNDICKEIREWLKPKNTLLNSIHCHLFNSTPRVLAEELLMENDLHDYKFFCFNGEPHFLYVSGDHFNADGTPRPSDLTFYSMDQTKMNIRYGIHLPGNDRLPIHFEEMREISRIMSEGFPFVRVDFFEYKDSVYLSELTFNPGGGRVKFYPDHYNDEFGEMIILPIDKNHEVE